MTVATMAGNRKLDYDPKMDKLLEAAGMDVTEFARSADMSYSQAHDIMVNGITDGRRLGTLKKIAEAFGVTLHDLLNGK